MGYRSHALHHVCHGRLGDCLHRATLPKPIYLELPPGHVQANPGAQDKVMKINKSLFAQAPLCRPESKLHGRATHHGMDQHHAHRGPLEALLMDLVCSFRRLPNQ